DASRLVRDFLAGRPLPVLAEAQLGRQYRRALEADVGVAPVPEDFRAPHVFVADIEAADPGFPAVGDDDLAVIAVLDAGWAEHAQDAVAVVESVDGDAGRPQPLLIGLRQEEAADVVVEQMDAHA